MHDDVGAGYGGTVDVGAGGDRVLGGHGGFARSSGIGVGADSFGECSGHDGGDGGDDVGGDGTPNGP